MGKRVLRTQQELADYLGVSRSTVARNISKIPCYYVGNKRGWRTADLKQFMKRGGTNEN